MSESKNPSPYEALLVDAYRDYLMVTQGSPEAAALLTLTQVILEIFQGNEE